MPINQSRREVSVRHLMDDDGVAPRPLPPRKLRPADRLKMVEDISYMASMADEGNPNNQGLHKLVEKARRYRTRQPFIPRRRP